MEELGFINLDSDAGLFKCFDEASQMFVITVVYVDDTIHWGQRGSYLAGTLRVF